ncbi:MAG: sulfatase-like hydrolase/transferase [Bryobacteraceae bacterium]|nr:sulfatase-like hydrolase/transferase [Bryobacteraceae bacterium]MDW8379945.1 sulfatase-like hydrolase/transferase [Bryobacterales bacterium]
MNSATRRHLPSRRDLLGALSLAAPVDLRAQISQRPNVVLILADDFGYECVGAYGGLSYRTPQLDRMAASGVRFTHAYAQPLCTPTRIQLMTGQHNFRNWKAFGIMDPAEKTFGHMMQRAGYRTAIVGKWQFYSYEAKGSPRYAKGMKPEQGGFDEYLLWHAGLTETKGSRYADPVLNENGVLRRDTKGKYGPDLELEFLSQFIQRNKNQPFFAYYAMTLTHGPFNPTPKSADWAHQDRLKDDPKYFADMVEYLDDSVGRILRLLEQTGLSSKTLVLFYSDNGTPQEITSRTRERTIPGGKGKTTDAGMHVPLIAWWPGVAAEGKLCHDLIDSTDFLPTLMEATGARWFEGRPLDGRSFLPQIKGQQGNPRPWAFSHYDPHPGCKVNYTPTRLAWDHQHKLYLDGRFYDWQADYFEQNPIPSGQATPAQNQARQKLQQALDQMATIMPPRFNRFETDGRKAY